MIRGCWGVDPRARTRCGVGVVDVAPNRTASLVHVGVHALRPTDMPLEQRLARIADGIEASSRSTRPQAVALERVFAQQNRRTVMGTAQASGVALLSRGATGSARRDCTRRAR